MPRPTHETLEPNGLGLVLRDSTWVQTASDGTPGGAGYPGITVHTSDAIHESRSYYSADDQLRVHQTNRATHAGLQTTRAGSRVGGWHEEKEWS